MTTAGPEPLETRQSPIDYDHYLTRQLQPVADAILPFTQDDFTTLITGQMGLFNDNRVVLEVTKRSPSFTIAPLPKFVSITFT